MIIMATRFASDRQRKAVMRRLNVRRGNPFAGYKDFDACVKANLDKRDPQAYCGTIKRKIESA